MIGGPFEKRVVAIVAVVGVVSLLAFLVLLLFGDEIGEVSSSGSDSFSRSAVGHMAFVQFLEKLEIPVSVSRFASGDKARAGSVLVIAEPRIYGADESAREKLERMIREADFVLLVLPKWWTLPDPEHPGFARMAELVSREAVDSVLDAAGVEAKVSRLGKGEYPRWVANDLGGRPYLRHAQLLESRQIDPIVTSDRGILLGEVHHENGRLFVLSDPDVISTHGLGRGDNAVLALAALEDLGAGDRPVIVDETLHGHEVAPNIWRSLFTFPLSLATAHAAILLVLVLWAAMGRFGAPLPAEKGLEKGKGLLIRNTADLLEFGGHSRSVLKRYLSATIGEVAQALHAPAGLSTPELYDWLAEAGERRSATIDPRRLAEDVRRMASAPGRADAGIPAIAAEIHRYREEILNGPGNHSRRG